MVTLLQASRYSVAGPAGDETTAAKKHMYVYDAWNLPRRQAGRLVKFYEDKNTDGDPDSDELRATCEYDPASPRLRRAGALNRRIVKLMGTDPGNPSEQYDDYYNTSWPVVSFVEPQVVEVRKNARSRAHKQYVRDLRGSLPRARGVHSPVVRFRNTDGDMAIDDETIYYTNDANMNVTAVVEDDDDDGAWAVEERYVYDPYGKPTIYDATWSTKRGSSHYANQILYCGYRYDPETGLYHVRHRPYHPTLGRWAVRDFEDYKESVSLYAYCLGSPVTNEDHLGKQSSSTSKPSTQPTTAPSPLQTRVSQYEEYWLNAAFYDIPEKPGKVRPTDKQKEHLNNLTGEARSEANWELYKDDPTAGSCMRPPSFSTYNKKDVKRIRQWLKTRNETMGPSKKQCKSLGEDLGVELIQILHTVASYQRRFRNIRAVATGQTAAPGIKGQGPVVMDSSVGLAVGNYGPWFTLWEMRVYACTCKRNKVVKGRPTAVYEYDTDQKLLKPRSLIDKSWCRRLKVKQLEPVRRPVLTREGKAGDDGAKVKIKWPPPLREKTSGESVKDWPHFGGAP